MCVCVCFFNHLIVFFKNIETKIAQLAAMQNNNRCDDDDDDDDDRGKHQTAREVAGRQPVLHYWDWEEPKLLVCEAEFVGTSSDNHDNTTAATGTGSEDKKNKKPTGIQVVLTNAVVHEESVLDLEDPPGLIYKSLSLNLKSLSLSLKS